MLAICYNSVSNRQRKASPLTVDPTRLATVRRMFTTQVRLRFNRLKAELVTHVLEQPFINGVLSLTIPQKTDQLRKVLEHLIVKHILPNQSNDQINSWFAVYLDQAYRKGADRSFTDVRQLAQREKLEFFQGARSEFLRLLFSGMLSPPDNQLSGVSNQVGQVVGGGRSGGGDRSGLVTNATRVEIVEALADRSYTDLKGITGAMSQQITTELIDGLVQGRRPDLIARRISERVDKIGRARALTLVQTEITRAHAEGQIEAMAALGQKQLAVAVEWRTAGDNRVCPLCAPLQGIVLTLKEARGAIPRHPRCRCAFIPASFGVSEKRPGQKRQKREVERAIDKSVKAELPKRTKTTIKTQRRKSRWVTARKTIRKRR